MAPIHPACWPPTRPSPIWIARRRGAGACGRVLFAGVKVPLSYLVRNLTVRWRTTLMTALAFVMVISLLTVMMAFVNGMYRLTQASGQPGNVMVMADGATDESFSNLDLPRHGRYREPARRCCGKMAIPSAAARRTSSSRSRSRTPSPAARRVASCRFAGSGRLGHGRPRAWAGALSRRMLAFRGGRARVGVQ